MAIKSCSKEISRVQRRLLDETLIDPLSPYNIRNFIRVASDRDIITGKEPLHPDWLDLFNTYRKDLQNLMGGEVFKEIRIFFDSLKQIDLGVSEIDPQAVGMTFLLGAGASKPEPSGIPTVKELLPDMLENARRLDREDVTQLAEFCENTKIGNIEDLLTAAELAKFCSRNPIILNLIDFLLYRQETIKSERFTRQQRSTADFSSVAFLQDTLQILFGLLSNRMLPAKPNKGHKAIAEYAKQKAGTAIVTTNWDCCMDLALGKEEENFTYMIEFANNISANKNNEKLTTLIKLHGSLNWFYCETCQQVNLISMNRMVDNYLADKAFYPVIAVCKGCGGPRRGLLVPPLAMKFDIAPPLNPLIEEAQRAFNAADIVVVVGFSFADADLYISRMLSKWMQISKNGKLVVFDPDYYIVDKIRNKFDARIPHFNKERILRVQGDCSDTLPKFLSGKFYEKEKDNKPSKGNRAEYHHVRKL